MKAARSSEENSDIDKYCGLYIHDSDVEPKDMLQKFAQQKKTKKEARFSVCSEGKPKKSAAQSTRKLQRP